MICTQHHFTANFKPPFEISLEMFRENLKVVGVDTAPQTLLVNLPD